MRGQLLLQLRCRSAVATAGFDHQGKIRVIRGMVSLSLSSVCCFLLVFPKVKATLHHIALLHLSHHFGMRCIWHLLLSCHLPIRPFRI